MKKILLLALITAITFNIYAQDCSSAEDCLNKGKASNSESQSFEFYDKALKLAKKENYNPSQIYLFRGIKYYKLYTPNYKDAEKDFKASIKEDEKNIYPYLWISNIYAYGDKDQKKAINYLTDLLQKFPSNVNILRERANINKYYNNISAAATDYEMAYNLLMDDPNATDVWNAADIVRWNAELYMRQKNLKLADEQTVKILADGLKLSPNSALLLGDLALAYSDIGNNDKAFELGRKAHAIDPANVGSIFVAIDALEKNDYYTAASLSSQADRAAMQSHGHPLVYYYYASSQWAYCFNVAKNQWVNYKGMIQNRLELAIQSGTGTRYDQYAQHAKEMLKTINN